LEEAAQCFRHELYLSAVVMIGKAAEDTWTQLGQALVGVFPRAVKLSDPLLHIGRRVNDTQKLLESAEGKELLKQAEVHAEELRGAVIWSHVVREARNAVHYGTANSAQNNYEKVAVLLLSTVPNLRILYRLISRVQHKATAVAAGPAL